MPEDRHGVRDSIIGRIQRVGGTTAIRSSETGTEVRIQVAQGSTEVAEDLLHFPPASPPGAAQVTQVP